MKFSNALAIVVGSLIMHNSVSHAAVTIDVVESGANVVATTTGTLNPTGLTFRAISSLGNNGMVYGSGLSIAHDGGILTGAAGPLGVYTLDTTVVFSTGNLIAATSGSGDAVGFDSRNENTTVPDNLYLPNGYVSGTPISSTSTWALTDIATLGLIPGTYVVSWSSDSLTLNIGGAAPPPTYSVGGSVSGLTGTGLALQNNGGDTLAVAAAATAFTFTTELLDLAAYEVTVSTQPTGQTCSVTNGSGAIAAADVTDVVVDCVDDVVVVPPTPAAPIPTLSQWALIMLSMFLGLMVFANRRRLF